MKLIRPFLLLCVLFSASKSMSQISGIVNEYRKVIAVDSARGTVKLLNAGGMTQYIGRTVMLIQMKGAAIDETSQSVNFGNVNNINQAGNFEFAIICGQESTELIMENKLQNFYDPSGYVQLVVLPKYTSVTVTDTLKAKCWDAANGIGGIVAIEASDTVFLNAPVYADSAGFKGGSITNYTSGDCANNSFPFAGIYACTDYYLPQYPFSSYLSAGQKGESISVYISNKDHARGKQANGGGGGNNSNHGGGGGSNFGMGGDGGYNTSGACTNRYFGYAGLSLNSFGYSSSNYRIFLGGGGGAGHQNNNVGTPGGNGGGIVYIKARVIVSVNQKITANGGMPYRAGLYANGNAAGGDGGGGGGAGGVVILNTSIIAGTLNIEAVGAKGSNTGADAGACAGPGGGGGGGAIWVSQLILPPTVITNSSGGANGIALPCSAPNGAGAGSAGSLITLFSLPALRDSSPVCKAILPERFILSFKGIEGRNGVNLVATLRINTPIEKLMFQRSFDGTNFNDILVRNNNGGNIYSHNDALFSTIVFYRLKVVSSTGQTQYSQVVIFRNNTNVSPVLVIFPNPAEQRLSFTIKVKEKQIVNAAISDETGKIYTLLRLILHPLVEQYALPLTGFAKGNYQLTLSGDKIKMSKRFSKL